MRCGDEAIRFGAVDEQSGGGEARGAAEDHLMGSGSDCRSVWFCLRDHQPVLTFGLRFMKCRLSLNEFER